MERVRVRRSVIVVGAVGAFALALAWILVPGGDASSIRVWTARAILTMEPDPPTATAVAVRDGRILAVGSLGEVRAALGDRSFEIDERFSEKVLLPGFIDPHLHPTLAASILPLEIVSAMEWVTPRGRTPAVRGHDAFLERLRQLDRAQADEEVWLRIWGYHRPYHGELSRAVLDQISTTRPILVWHRSVHEMFFNGRALSVLGLSSADFAAHPQADWETGHLWETAVLTLGAPAMRVLTGPLSYRRGLGMMSEVIHRGGLTTVAEQGFPQVSEWGELLMLHLEMRTGDVPYRFVLVPNAMYLLRENADAAEAERAASRMLSRSTRRVCRSRTWTDTTVSG
jgi:predicted amidohydrolase YtcJ